MKRCMNSDKRRVRKGLPPREPIYTENDVRGAMELFEVVNYDETINVNGSITARFYDAGHILGASSIQINITEKNKATTLVFSGDLGQYDAPIVKDPYPIKEADYVFIESTYGDRLHEPVGKRKHDLSTKENKDVISFLDFGFQFSANGVFNRFSDTVPAITQAFIVGLSIGNTAYIGLIQDSIFA